MKIPTREDLWRGNLVQLGGIGLFLSAFIEMDWVVRVLAVGAALETGRYFYSLWADRERAHRRVLALLEAALTELEQRNPEAVDRVLEDRPQP